MNLKKYEKLRMRFENNPVDWLGLYVREQMFCRNYQKKIVGELIDTDIIYPVRYQNNGKIFRNIAASLKEKTKIDFQVVECENDTYRIVPAFILELKQKAELGDGNAMLEYSEYLQNYFDLEEAHQWHTKSARAGNPKAMAEEGRFILNGWVKGTLTDAMEYFRKANEAGEKSSYFNLAECYIYGWGVKQDFEKAKQLLKTAGRFKFRRLIKKIDSEEFRKSIDGKKILNEIREFHN